LMYEMIKELGTDKALQCLGRPKYAKGEYVMFYTGNSTDRDEHYGRIEIIDLWGTMEQQREVSYDILGSDNVLYKHIVESNVHSFSK